jgi:hypothetical protein
MEAAMSSHGLLRPRTRVLAAQIAVALALVLSTTIATAQVRDAQASAAGAGRIAGTVTAADTGRPLPGANVALNPATGQTRRATTDTLGQFAFDALEPGEYTLRATRAPYLEAIYGQVTPGSGRPGTPIVLAEGERRAELELALPPGGVITGVVIDQFSYPSARTRVRAYRYAYRNGVRALEPAGTAETDDRGIYRIFDLEPGDYVVVATPRVERQVTAVMAERLSVELVAVRTEMVRVEASAARMADVERELATRAPAMATAADAPASGYAPVYFPGTTRSSMASAVALGPSEEKSGVDIALEIVPMATIQGSVAGVMPLPRGVRVVLTEDSPIAGLGTRTVRVGPDGTFSITGVPPGEYQLRANATVRRPESSGPGTEGLWVPDSLPETYWAHQSLTLSGQTTVPVSLTLQPAITASGMVVFDGAADRPDLSRIRINFLPASTSASEAEMEFGSAVGRVEDSGAFSATGLVPGLYRVTSSAAGGWHLASVIAGGREVLDVRLDVRAGEDVGGLVVTFADRATTLSGSVTRDGQPAPGYTVVVFSEDRQHWLPGSRRIQSARPSSDGRYRVTGLPPGAYRLAALEDPEPGVWFEPEFLAQLLAASIPVTLGEGESASMDVRIGR